MSSTKTEPTSPMREFDLAVAENRCIQNEIATLVQGYLREHLRPCHFSYNKHIEGEPALLEALCNLFNTYWLPCQPVRPDHIALSAGGSMGLTTLVQALCKPNDGVLVPTPYWNGFDFHLEQQVPVCVVPVRFDGFLDSFDSACLIRMLEQARSSAAVPVTALLITNPHNPLGRCYSADNLVALATFCERHDIQFISDEVYALSTFSPNPEPSQDTPPPFVSALSLNREATGCQASRVHVVWSMSKDLACNGLRLASVISQDNDSLLRRLAVSGCLQISNLATVSALGILTAPNLLNLIAENRAQLGDCYRIMTTFLDRRRIEYIPATAGLFVFARLIPAHNTKLDEAALAKILKDAGILVATGQTFHTGATSTGWFRLVFSIGSLHLQALLKRLGTILDSVMATNGRQSRVQRERAQKCRMLRRERRKGILQLVNRAIAQARFGKTRASFRSQIYMRHIQSSMEFELQQLNTTLTGVLDQLRGALNHELIESLHAYRLGQLPDPGLSGLAADTVDRLHAVEQLLTPAPLILADHFLGYVDTKCLCAVVQLGVPDHLQQGALPIPELARLCDARADRLKQVMRVLYHKGIFSWDATTGMYGNNSTSELLTRAHWTQWRNWVDLYGTEFYDIARGIPMALAQESKRTAAQINFQTDQNMFEYFVAQGWLPRLHRTLGGGAAAQSPGIIADYPWHEFGTGPFLDIGGGEGAFVAMLLRQYPALKGALLDTARVIDHAHTFFHGPGGKFADIADQLAPDGLMAGDFFTQIPTFEFYTIKWCLHDWKDKEAALILSNIRRAINPTVASRLVVLESILAGGRSGRLSRYADINMMMTADGQERTEAEWRILAAETGWQVSRICVLRGAWPSAIELRPVPAQSP